MTIRYIKYFSIACIIFSLIYGIGVFVFPNKPTPTLPAQMVYLFFGLMGVLTTNIFKKMSARITALEEKLQEKN